MKKDQLFLSTIAPDAAEEARRHGLGLEIAEYCTAWNMDEQFETTHAAGIRSSPLFSGRIF